MICGIHQAWARSVPTPNGYQVQLEIHSAKLVHPFMNALMIAIGLKFCPLAGFSSHSPPNTISESPAATAAWTDLCRRSWRRPGVAATNCVEKWT